MPKETQRQQRVAEMLQREIAMLLQTDIADQRAKFATLTRVIVSADLHYAKIFFTTLDESKVEPTGYALNRAVSYLRRKIAANLKLRIVPELRFIYDESLEKTQQLLKLIDHAVKEDQLITINKNEKDES